MDTRPRTRLMLRNALLASALGALVVPATANAAVKPPVITKVTPANASVGETLTVTGRNFRVGKGRNTLLFKRDGGKALFVKAGLATKKKITVAIPKKLEKYMAVKDGKPVATRFRLSVLTSKLSKSFTAVKGSPVIGPEQVKPTGGGGAGAGAGAGGGTSAPVLDPNADCDGDGLTNSLESGVLKTDPCNADSDGDGVTDGYEYSSAIDLNNDDYRHPTASLPYPGKRPYPNPLDANDLNVDHDGDTLTLGEEYQLWRYSITQGANPSVQRLNYSAGLKYSIYTGGNGTPRTPALAAATYDKMLQFENWIATSGYQTIDLPDQTGVNFFDVNRNGVIDPVAGGRVHSESSYLDFHNSSPTWYTADGYLSDDERDEDADGLSNADEFQDRMAFNYWKSYYKGEKPYVIEYAGTSPVDPDSDGDGVLDGADDQDHDDVPNFHELSRSMISGRTIDSRTTQVDDVLAENIRSRVNPFNPCLPFIYSRTCPVAVPFDNAYAPFDTDKPMNKFLVFQ